jgi:hypothetical protein
MNSLSRPAINRKAVRGFGCPVDDFAEKRDYERCAGRGSPPGTMDDLSNVGGI